MSYTTILYGPSSFTGVVQEEEVCNAIERAELTLMQAALNDGTTDLYAIKKSSCNNKKTSVLCLFFYTYALEAWCNTGYNYMSEAQLKALLACVEQTSKICCNE